MTSAARLTDQMQIGVRDGVGIEQAVRLVGRYRPACAADAPVDHDMSDVNALRMQLARHALRQPRSANLPIAKGADCA